MSYSFGSQKNDPIFGTYGDFTVGSTSNQVRAQYLLTKVKPGSEGNWENLLASQMIPWREVFNIEEITFDELLQRDLDDSRVAHDLIPYLLGEKEASARFFPPILAVLVPKNIERAGIQPRYPALSNQDDIKLSFGDLFDFEKIRQDGEVTPFGVIKYNRQKTSFIIADGQHRAMAVLALHRQLNSSWGTDRYASYYNHLLINADQIKNIELSVCIIFFPDLHEGNEAFLERGIDLKKVCREIFLVVNKTAKKVSESRELLLDDEDFAARMMRTTLSKLKGRGEDEASLSRIYSIAFGDAEADMGKQVVTGRLEYASAVALYKMQAAVSFGAEDAFNFESPSDITDGRRTRNNSRPTYILLGTPLEKWNSLSRLSGKYHPPADVELAVDLLSDVTDVPMLQLFDKFRPFAAHNNAMRVLRNRLLDPSARADLIQSKCYSLLFEGSGVRNVFEDHVKRLRERKEDLEERGETVGDYIINQLNDATAVVSALDKHEQLLKNLRAARLFNIDAEKFFSAEDNEQERKELLARARPIFDTVSTQAFQLGFLMAIHSVVEQVMEPGTAYKRRLQIIKFVTGLYIDALNEYFSTRSETEHRRLTGLINESRAKVFDSTQLGLRGLLAQSVRELNERQWVFFRYAILEIVHSKHAYSSLLQGLNTADDPSLAEIYRNYLPDLVKSILLLREHYTSNAVQTALNLPEFKMELETLKARSLGEGKSEEEAEEIVRQRVEAMEKEIREKSRDHIAASLGEFAKVDKIVNRLSPVTPPATAVEGASSE